MNTVLALIGCVVFGLAGWYLYRNPRKVLDAVYKQYQFQYGSFTLGFFRIFGATMVVMGCLGSGYQFVRCTVACLPLALADFRFEHVSAAAGVPPYFPAGTLRAVIVFASPASR